MKLLRAIALPGLMLAACMAFATPASALSPTYEDPVAFALGDDVAMSVDALALIDAEIVRAEPDAPAMLVAPLETMAGEGWSGVWPVPIAPALEPPVSLVPV